MSAWRETVEWAACQSPERSRTRDPAVPVEKQGGPAWARDRRLGPERLGQREPGSKIMAGLSPWLSWQQGSGHLSGKVNRKLPVRVSCSLFRVAYSQMKITIKSPAFLSNRSRATSPLPHTCQAGRSLGSRTARSRKRGAPQVSWDLGGGQTSGAPRAPAASWEALLSPRGATGLDCAVFF